MKIYEFGSWDAPVLLLLPGTCCHWKKNFGHVIPLLKDDFHVICVSYDGFDENEDTVGCYNYQVRERVQSVLFRSDHAAG